MFYRICGPLKYILLKTNTLSFFQEGKVFIQNIHTQHKIHARDENMHKENYKGAAIYTLLEFFMKETNLDD